MSDHYRRRQARNVKILYGLISPLFLDVGIKMSTFSDDDRYVDEKRWIKSLDGEGISVLNGHNFDDTAVIGFEINPIDKIFLSKNHIPWINIEIHPIRFLEDLYFSVTSSFDFNFDLLSCDEKQIQFTANILKLKNLERPYDIEDNALVIIGQTPDDKSIYFDHTFTSLLDYLDQLEALSKEHDHIYYRPHPIESDKAVDAEIMKRFDASILPDINYYDLISSNSIKTVCGISSSSLHEAKYFQKNVIFLEKRINTFSQPVSLKSLLESDALWFKELLSMEEKRSSKNIFIFRENLCRDLYGYWSYETSARQATSLADTALLRANEANSKATEAHQVLTSTSWKLTEPLRNIMSYFKR